MWIKRSRSENLRKVMPMFCSFFLTHYIIKQELRDFTLKANLKNDQGNCTMGLILIIFEDI